MEVRGQARVKWWEVRGQARVKWWGGDRLG